MSTPFIGSIQYFGFNYAPKGWLQCAGQLMPIAQYQALFSLLGTYYGGDGRVTFGLPDLRGRTIIGQGPNWQMGQRGGVEGATMTVNSMPGHLHTGTVQIGANNTNGDQADPTANVAAVPPSRGLMYATAPKAAYLGTPVFSVGATGASQPFSVMNPYLALTCGIALSGLFPSRN